MLGKTQNARKQIFRYPPLKCILNTWATRSIKLKNVTSKVFSCVWHCVLVARLAVQVDNELNSENRQRELMDRARERRRHKRPKTALDALPPNGFAAPPPSWIYKNKHCRGF